MQSRRSFLRLAGSAGLALLPSDPLLAAPEREGSLTYRDPRLGASIPARGWTLYVPRVASGMPRDPKFNAAYPYQLHVQCTTHDPADPPEVVRGGRRFVVHYLRTEDTPLARRVGGVMARLYWVGKDYLGRGPSDRETLDVWLSRSGQPGGEEYQGSIYLYAIDSPRAPAEWLRELAHEYGHRSLPELGEYHSPERWASGYLGERLYLKWMLADNGLADAWETPIDGALYVKNQVTPLVNRYLDAGPADPALAGTDETGMLAFIGQVMAVEAAHGPAVLRALMNRFQTPRPQNLGLHLARAIADLNPTRLPLDPAAYVPSLSRPAPGGGSRFAKAVYRVLLPEGDWRVDLEGRPSGGSISLDGIALPTTTAAGSGSAAWHTEIREAVWRKLEVTAASEPVEIRRLTLTRRDQPAGA